MLQVSVSDMRKDFAQIMDSAQKEPVVVRKQDQDYVAIISMTDYETLVQLKNQRLKKLAQDIGEEAQNNGLTPEILQELLNSNL